MPQQNPWEKMEIKRKGTPQEKTQIGEKFYKRVVSDSD